MKYSLEFKDSLDRVKNDLEQGILKKYSVLRNRQIDGIVIKNCYQSKNLTFLEAEHCH